MAFFNENVSEEDVEKYKLKELHLEWWGEIPPRFRYTWTRDIERDSFYIPMRTGREEFSNRVQGILHFQGENWTVEVSLDASGSKSFSENPYRIVWGLGGIKHQDKYGHIREMLIPILKEALQAYKVSGINTSEKATDVVTSFTF